MLRADRVTTSSSSTCANDKNKKNHVSETVLNILLCSCRVQNCVKRMRGYFKRLLSLISLPVAVFGAAADVVVAVTGFLESSIDAFARCFGKRLSGGCCSSGGGGVSLLQAFHDFYHHRLLSPPTSNRRRRQENRWVHDTEDRFGRNFAH